MALTEKQKRFCDEYLVDLNATQAAIRAGYSEKTAKQIAQQNLTRKTAWTYKDRKGKWHRTSGKRPSRALNNAFASSKGKLKS